MWATRSPSRGRAERLSRDHTELVSAGVGPVIEPADFGLQLDVASQSVRRGGDRYHHHRLDRAVVEDVDRRHYDGRSPIDRLSTDSTTKIARVNLASPNRASASHSLRSARLGTVPNAQGRLETAGSLGPDRVGALGGVVRSSSAQLPVSVTRPVPVSSRVGHPGNGKIMQGQGTTRDECIAAERMGRLVIRLLQQGMTAVTEADRVGTDRSTV